ncbi:MAG TPA: hypothetical protein ENK18_10305 [Deltaproteobacteria bacterium]|nr:hypothetical protein [Deltaproteobacteria bacterium]
MFWFDALESLFPDPDFWRHLAQDPSPPEPLPELEGCVVLLPVGEGYSLQLRISPDLSSSLSLCWGDRIEPIARDGPDGGCPHGLRWVELDAVCRSLAATHPEVIHPGPALLLLHRFAPICEGDDVGWIVAQLVEAFQTTTTLSKAQILDQIERIDLRGEGARWLPGPRGWGLQVDRGAPGSPCSLRLLDRAGAPGPDRAGAPGPDRAGAPGPDRAGAPGLALDAMVAGALDRVGPPRPVPASPLPPGLIPRPQHRLRLRLIHDDPQRPFPPVAAGVLAAVLDGLLRSAGRGRASVHSTGEARSVLSLRIVGGLQEGLQGVREALWWLGAPGPGVLDDGARPPLVLDRAPEEGWSGGLMAVDFEVVHLGPQDGYRIERAVLGGEHTIRTWLEVVGAGAVGPDGWQQIRCSDGGVLRIRVQRTGIAISFERLSPGVSAVVHRMIGDQGLVLAPMGIVAEAGHGILGVPWPSMSVVSSPRALHELLEAGPYSWWCRGPG